MGDQEFHSAQGYCVAGRKCREPFSSLFTAAEGKGLLDCLLHPWWMFRKDRAHPEQMCVGQECCGKSWLTSRAGGRWRCCLPLSEHCSPWGSAAQGLYQPTAAGLDRDGSFPVFPTGPRPTAALVISTSHPLHPGTELLWVLSHANASIHPGQP